MTSEAFTKNWTELGNRPAPFQKLDCVIRNPAPAHVPCSTVIKQIANFFRQCLSMSVFESEMRVRAAGLANFQPESQTGFPAGAQD
jgi:hypothetical protein